MKKTICSILALLMVLSLFVACDSNVDPQGTEAPSHQETTEAIETSNESEKQNTDTETEKSAIEVIAITLDNELLTLGVGERQALVATLEPSNADDTHLTWSSTNENVAMVSSNGVVFAVSTGNAIIKVTTTNGLSAMCSVTVTNATETETLKPEVTDAPTTNVTEVPTTNVTEAPTAELTEAPTETPTEVPTEDPTEEPTEDPTEEPTEVPTETPTEKPTEPPIEAPEINYGTLTSPVTTTYAYEVCYNIPVGETSLQPFYVKGTVTEIGETGSYYKNVYFTDGKTSMLIHTINMSDGITGFKVGDTITAYGYIKNYNGTIEMATYNGSVYVYVVKVETSGGSTGGNTNTTSRTYTDFTANEKSLFTQYIGEIIPFIPNDEYYVDEYSDTDYDLYGINFYTFGNTQAEFDAYLKLFSSYTNDGTEVDDYGDTWYYYSRGDVYVDICYYNYDGEYVVDLYAYVEGSGSTGGNGGTIPDDSEINYGTLTSPVTTTYAVSANSTLADGKFSAQPFYVKGTVTAISKTGNYYEDVYFTDGTTSMLIHTINMSDGITGFQVGDTITAYGYVKNYQGTIIEMASKGSTYVYVVKVETSGGSTGGNTNTTSRTYTDFTANEKSLFTQYIGEIIPFIPNDEYYVEGYYDETGYEYGMCFYTFGNTQEEFDAYLEKFSSYELYETYEDDYGDTWYCYVKNDDVVVDVSYYYYEGEWVVDLYVYSSLSKDLEDDGGSIGGNGDVDLITNEGKGLPKGTNGVFNIDFTKAENIKNVTDQGYYIDGCPTTGSPAILVIPVEFSDITAESKGYTTEDLEKIFNGTGNDTIYYSVHDYYFASSYNTLDLNVTVLDSWFMPEYTSSYYENATYDYYGMELAIGDQFILDEALAYLSTVMDLSEFDSDDNGIIDAVIMVNTLDIDSETEFRWAYRYWNIYTDDEGNYYEYDAVSANDYIWMAYGFMFEGYDEETGEVNYDSTNPLNPYTFIHEFGHMLGADDYYDTSYEGAEPLGGLDVMDAMMGDHNPYSKFNYGWLTESRLVVTDSTVTLTLDAFAENGDTIILANNWDEALGAYQEYYIIAYYTGTGLNSGEGGYFLRDGIIVYHVNASLYAEEYDGEIYYDVYNNNTSASSEYGTEDNLIEYVKSAEDNYTYIAGDSLPTVTDDQGNTLGYTFTVDSIEDGTATLTFTKIG